MAGNPWRALRALAHVDLRWHQMRGRLGRTDGDVITLHPHQGQAQRRCTLQHDLIHLARGTAHDHDPAEEAAVEQAAARVLLPLPLLLDKLRWTQDMSELAEECWVDEPMLKARLDGLSDRERAMTVAFTGG